MGSKAKKFKGKDAIQMCDSGQVPLTGEQRLGCNEDVYKHLAGSALHNTRSYSDFCAGFL